MLQETFSRVQRYIWTIGNEEKTYELELVEKILSALLHIAGLHEWPQGRFVDICEQYLNFPINNFAQNGEIRNIYMRNHLRCTHGNIDNETVINAQSPVFKALIDDICSNNRIKQFKRISTTLTTSSIESFHSVAIMYKTKRYHL